MSDTSRAVENNKGSPAERYALLREAVMALLWSVQCTVTDEGILCVAIPKQIYEVVKHRLTMAPIIAPEDAASIREERDRYWKALDDLQHWDAPAVPMDVHDRIMEALAPRERADVAKP